MKVIITVDVPEWKKEEVGPFTLKLQKEVQKLAWQELSGSVSEVTMKEDKE